MKASTKRSEGVICSDCGDLASVAWVHPTSPNIATPYCGRCSMGNMETERDIAEHEMNNFGGYYGVPGHTEHPIEEFSWYKRQDGRFQATL